MSTPKHGKRARSPDDPGDLDMQKAIAASMQNAPAQAKSPYTNEERFKKDTREAMQNSVVYSYSFEVEKQMDMDQAVRNSLKKCDQSMNGKGGGDDMDAQEAEALMRRKNPDTKSDQTLHLIEELYRNRSIWTEHVCPVVLHEIIVKATAAAAAMKCCSCFSGGCGGGGGGAAAGGKK